MIIYLSLRNYAAVKQHDPSVCRYTLARPVQKVSKLPSLTLTHFPSNKGLRDIKNLKVG